MEQSTSFTLDVLVHGNNARQYYNNGKYYVEGRKDTEFKVKIRNRTGRRALAVLTVDGLSVITGETGSFDSSGYILGPWEEIIIPGWRLNNKEVAKFEFERGDKSYASSKGKGIHNGVIGCAFFFEKEQPKVTWSSFTYEPLPKNIKWFDNNSTSSPKMQASYSAQSLRGSSMGAQSLYSSSASNDFTSYSSSSLGTGFGDKLEHKVSNTTFDTASTKPIEVLSVYYDTRQGLEARGISLGGAVEIASPFPTEDLNDFCQPPKDWN